MRRSEPVVMSVESSPSAPAPPASASPESASPASSSPASGRVATPRLPWLGLIVLASSVFLSVTSEMMPTGLLPDMSGSLGVSESQIGLLVTVFAFTVVLSSTPLAALTRRVPRHTLLVVVLTVFSLSNLLTALSPSYEMVVASRVLGGLSHGLFWAIVSAYTAHLVPREQLARAVAITLGGGTLAFVLGVPLGTALGHFGGWRWSFGIVAALTLVGAFLVWRLLPPVRRASDAGADASATDARPRASRVVPRRLDPSVAAVALLSATTAVVMVGHYAFYTYVAPFFIERVGVEAGAVAPLLFGYGAAGAVGLVMAGSRFVGRRPTRTLAVSLAAVALFFSIMTVFADVPWLVYPAFVLWGIAFGVLPALLQTRLLSTASPAIRDTASAVYATAFNAGIGAGALVGSVAYDSVGLVGPSVVYVALVLVALAVVVVAFRARR